MQSFHAKLQISHLKKEFQRKYNDKQNEAIMITHTLIHQNNRKMNGRVLNENQWLPIINVIIYGK